MPRTPSVREDRREQIIDAAMRVFAQKGFARATNRDVAREAEITTGLIYYYFENKEALFKAIMEERSPMRIVSTVTPEMLEQPPEVFLPMIIKQVLGVVENERFLGIIRVMLPEVLHNPEVAQVANSFAQRVFSFIRGYLQIQMTKGTLRADLNPDTATHTLMGGVAIFVARRQILLDSQVTGYTHDEIAQSVVSTILQGIKP